jgi:hypothetical protein
MISFLSSDPPEVVGIASGSDFTKETGCHGMVFVVFSSFLQENAA